MSEIYLCTLASILPARLYYIHDRQSVYEVAYLLTRIIWVCCSINYITRAHEIVTAPAYDNSDVEFSTKHIHLLILSISIDIAYSFMPGGEKMNVRSKDFCHYKFPNHLA
jgi:hypothetical protein